MELSGIPPGRSFLVSGENGLYTPCLRDVLHHYSSAGNSYDVKVVGEEINVGSVEYVYQVPTGFHYDKRMYGVRCQVKNVLDAECVRHLTDKKLLYDTALTYNPGNIGFYIPTTWEIGRFVLSDGIYILKATGDRTGCGKGNAVFSSPEEFELAKEKLSRNKYDLSTSIVSRYITSPILFEGRKTHFRTFIMLSTHSSTVSVFDKVVVRLATKSYVKDNYGDEGIHDTHTSSSGVDIYLPVTPYSGYKVFEEGDLLKNSERYTLLQKYYDRVMDATRHIAEMIKKSTIPKSPPESKHAFEVFAIDLIVTQSRVFLLEINTKVSYKSAMAYQTPTSSTSSISSISNSPTLEHVMFSNSYFSWIYTHGYLPFEQARTFAITGGTGLILSFLESSLLAFNWKRVKENEMTPSTYVYFNYLEKMSSDLRRFAPSAVRIRCHYKNILPPTKMCIADKAKLYENMVTILPGYVAKSWTEAFASMIPDDAKDKVLIIRPIGDYADSGFGVKVTSSKESFEEALKATREEVTNAEGKLSSYIVSEYITNPALYHSKKYHLRSFFIYRREGNNIRSSIFERSRIVTAKLPYVEGDWSNPLIHDTHSKTTDCNIFVDTPDLGELCDILTRIMNQYVTSVYEECKVGYEVFGLDILPTSSGYVLLEVNSRVGMKDLGDPVGCPYEDSFAKFSEDYFDWMLHIAL
jgi:hypothetical protein